MYHSIGPELPEAWAEKTKLLPGWRQDVSLRSWVSITGQVTSIQTVSKLTHLGSWPVVFNTISCFPSVEKAVLNVSEVLTVVPLLYHSKVAPLGGDVAHNLKFRLIEAFRLSKPIATLIGVGQGS